MWSTAFLCLLVGFAYAAVGPAWNDNSLYIYEVRARHLSGLNQNSNQYSGKVYKLQLHIQSRSDGNLNAKIVSPQHANVHGVLEEGWEQYIPDSELQYQQLPLSQSPFQILLKNGAVRGLIVNKKITNWEANMIKGIVSSFQLDTNAENLMESSINIRTQEHSNSAVFKTMEETVTGVSETSYEIHPLEILALETELPSQTQQSLSQDDEYIEIVKSKNYTNAEQFPSYDYGFDPAQNRGILARSTNTYGTIVGTLKDFTILNIVVKDQIAAKPTLDNNQPAIVNSKVNVTLLDVQQSGQSGDQVQDPVETSLVYSYNDPYATENSPREDKLFDHSDPFSSAETPSRESDRSKRTAESAPRSYDYPSYNLAPPDEEDWQQDKPHVQQAPPSPLLPFTIGYEGQSISKKQNIVETARKLAQEIAQELQHPSQILQSNTVGKAVTLTSLTRVMDANQVQQVASQLYSKQENPAWTVYRDAVAEAGSGPALVTIIDWIQTDKISEEEAAEVIATAANAARQPTVEYMKAFLSMLEDQQIMSKPDVNESIALSFTKLAHHVYADQEESSSKFPTNSYGQFRTPEGLNLLKKAIMVLRSRLDEAVANGDTQQIHVYIRALGNVGHQWILESFEKYLEGNRQVSQFQRLLMVLALDKLASSNPRVARSVLYKIYQNPSEDDQVRVAAVYQLMVTNPPPSMLQRLASYTNMDSSSHVNSAVKSVIESAAELQGGEHAKLRFAAQSAKPFLNNEDYGVQYSSGYLRSYLLEPIELSYKQYLQTFGGEDHALPKGLRYSLRRRFSGLYQSVFTMEAMSSSIDDLLNVLEQQTSKYQQQKSEKQGAGASRHDWSSEHVAQLLNMDNDQREQLEGFISMQMGSIQKFFSFDNQTLDILPEVVSEMEKELRQGKSYKYRKMIIDNEIAVAYPTALGLPFIYTYEEPTLIGVEANIQAVAQPQISSGRFLQKPNTVNAEYKIDAFVSGRIQSQLSVFTPFDQQRFSSGYNKNFQVIIPIAGKVDVDVRNKQLKADLTFSDRLRDASSLLHFSTNPYTAKNNIYEPKPNLKIIRNQHPYAINHVVGQKSTGLAVSFKLESDQKIDVGYLYQQLWKQDDLLSVLLSPWPNADIQYLHIDVGIDPQQSSSEKLSISLGYEREYRPSESNSGEQSSESSSSSSSHEQGSDSIPPLHQDPEKRQKQFVEKLSADVNNAQVLVADATVEFRGHQQFRYSATVGASKSNVDPKGRFMVLVRKEGSQHPLEFYLQGTTNVPNTNGLSLKYAMEMDPTSSANFQGALHSSQHQSKISGSIQLSKSQERKEYLQWLANNIPRSQKHSLAPQVVALAASANRLDSIVANVKFTDLDPKVINATYKLYGALRHALYSRLEENIIDNESNDQEVQILGQFSPDLQSLNFSISSDYGHAVFRNIELEPWVSSLLVPHPVFHLNSRIEGEALSYDTIRPVCTVDEAAINTLDNKTYPAQLQKAWSVLLQYIPRRPSFKEGQVSESVVEQLQEEPESYVVYVREQNPSQKEVKIVAQFPQTHGKIAEIMIKPSRESGPKVFANNEEVPYSLQRSSDLYSNGIQIYGLPNEEVKVELKNAFYVISNGHTVKLTTVNSKFRDAARGLCGTFTGDQQTDFLSPRNCILADPEEFLQAYMIPEDQSPPSQQQEGECYQKTVSYADYVSNQDSGRSSPYQNKLAYSTGSSCTMHQTQYVERHGDVCFTRRPLPVCKKGCRSERRVSKSVSMYCVSKSDPEVRLHKEQIEKGASPDLQKKPETSTIEMEVPQSCLP